MKRILSAVLLIGAFICFFPSTSAYRDVDAGDRYFQAIMYLHETNIVQGYDDETFKPDERINRAEFTKIIVKGILDYSEGNNDLNDLPLTDLEENAWYMPYIKKAYHEGLIQGYEDNTFRPERNINFVEAAKIINNAFGFENNPDIIWYKPYVNTLEAINAIPYEISGFNHEITRGEMAEMIFRIKTKNETLSSTTYEKLANKQEAPFISINKPVYVAKNKQFAHATIKGNHFEITGENSPDIDRIEVEYFADGDYENRDIYTLSQFQKGDTKWKYVADTKFDNLKNGLNHYRINAYINDSEITDKSLEVTAKTTDSYINVAGSNVQVDYLDTPEEVELEGFKGDSDEPLKAKKIGTISEGSYKGRTLYFASTGCSMGGCAEIRFVIDGDTLIIFEKVSERVTYLPNDENILKYIKDANTSFVDLFPPEEIAIPDSTNTLKRKYEFGYCFDEDEANVLFYSDEAQRDVIERNGNIIVKNSDETCSLYAIMFDFGNYVDIPSYGNLAIDINWDNGEKRKEFFSLNIHSYFGPDPYHFTHEEEGTLMFDDHEIVDLQIAGETPNGTKIYFDALSEEILEYMNNYKFGDKKNDEPTFEMTSFLENLAMFYDQAKRTYPDISFKDFYNQKHPVIFIESPFGGYIRLVKKGFTPPAEKGKPVIYLYPEQDQDIDVKIYPDGGFLITDPVYNDGWFVHSTTDSELYNYTDGKTYPYLFWEGNALDFKFPSQGFVVAKEDVNTVLREKLALLGLIEKEIDDFMEFWYPRMQKDPYYYISFIPKKIQDAEAPLEITPQPDTIIRVLMAYKGLHEKINMPEPVIKTPVRKGFTVSEWGGMILD